MPEQIRKLWDRLVGWWKKFNNRQRALLISTTAVVFVALAILGYAVSRPTYVQLVSVETSKEGSDIADLLSGENIPYKTNKDGTSFQVKKEDEAKASMLLGKNDIASASYSIDNVTGGGMSRTESDKQKLYQDFLEKKFTDHLMSLENVDNATVDITLPNNDGTILSKEAQGTAAVVLTLNDTMDSDKAYALARYIATELGNKDTVGITIIDSKSNVLYSGADADTSVGIVSSQLSYQEKQESMIKEEIKAALLQSKLYSNVEIAMNLSVNYDNTETATHEYYPPEGRSEGMMSSASEYTSETSGGTAATPGTDSNDDTTYVTGPDDDTKTSINETQYQYQPNEKVTNQTSSGGKIDYEKSSVSIVCTRYVTYDEALLEKSGELDDTTFEEFKASRSEINQVDVDESVMNLVSNATGFAPESITVVCYEQPEFIEKPTDSRLFSEILQIVLAVLVFALLGFVVFRSTRKPKETALEPELSVDGLLERTGELQESLEDIGYSEKSETRILIEKFVDENPDAVALLLRNWLNDEWE